MTINQFFSQFDFIDAQDIEQISSLARPFKLAKGEHFHRAGEVSKSVVFLQSGVFRSYYLNQDKGENTYCFFFPGTLVTAYSSFITGTSTSEGIQALSDIEGIQFLKVDLEDLQNQNIKWLRFMKMMAEEQYILMESRIFQLLSDSAEERYLELMHKNPEWVHEIPLQHLASYLGITQRHLSRLRKQIMN